MSTEINKPRSPLDFIGVRLHRFAWEALGIISRVLILRATQKGSTPLNFKLGRAQLLDTVIRAYAKAEGIDLDGGGGK